MKDTKQKTHFIIKDGRVVARVKDPELLHAMRKLIKDKHKNVEGGFLGALLPFLAPVLGSLASTVFGKIFHKGKGIQPKTLEMVSKSGKSYDLMPIHKMMLTQNDHHIPTGLRPNQMTKLKGMGLEVETDKEGGMCSSTIYPPYGSSIVKKNTRKAKK